MHMNPQKQIIVLVLVVGLAALAVWFGVQRLEQAPGNDIPTPEVPEQPQAERVTYTADPASDIEFSIDIPKAAEVGRAQETIYEVKYLGPNNEPFTEITDGYFIALRFVLDETVDAYLEGEAVVGEIETTAFLGYDALRYQKRSELDNRLVDHLVVIFDEERGRFVNISTLVYGDEDGAYRAEIDETLDTLSFSVAPGSGAGGDGGAGAGDWAGATEHPLIRVTTPARGAEVGSPITLSGEARGYWFFEATAPVVVVNWDGLILGEGYITADDEWMTEDFVPFTGTLEFTEEAETYSASGTVIFQRSNASGLPEHDDAFEIPVILESE